MYFKIYNQKILINIVILICLFFFCKIDLYSNVFSDLNKEPTIYIDLSKNKDATDDIKKDLTNDVIDSYSDTTDDISIINEWYSKGNVFIKQSLKYGVSWDTSDFLSERFLFKYRFRSKIKHSFSLRFLHVGYTTGILNETFKFFNFGFFSGFEYFYKVFDNLTGFFIWTDFGICNRGFALDFGLGLGNRMKNGIELEFTYMHNVAFFSKLEFYFLILNFFTIRGMLGLDIKHDDFIYIEKLTFLTGVNIGFLIKNIFRIEFGGGITLDKYSSVGGFGSVSITLNIF